MPAIHARRAVQSQSQSLLVDEASPCAGTLNVIGSRRECIQRVAHCTALRSAAQITRPPRRYSLTLPLSASIDRCAPIIFSSDNIAVGMVLEFPEPSRHVLKRRRLGDVVDQDGAWS